MRDLRLEQRGRGDHRDGGEQRGRVEAQAAALLASLAGLRVRGGDAHCVGVEARDVRLLQRVGEVAALRLAAAPQHPRPDRVAEPVAGAVHHLVGGVAVGADDLGHLGRSQAVTQREVEHLGVARTERVDRLPHQRDQFGVAGESGGLVELVDAVFRLRALDHRHRLGVHRCRA